MCFTMWKCQKITPEWKLGHIYLLNCRSLNLFQEEDLNGHRLYLKGLYQKFISQYIFKSLYSEMDPLQEREI